MKRSTLIFSSLLFSITSLYGFQDQFSPSVPMGQQQAQEPTEIIVNNRILTKVNGLPISTLDVQKQMDLFLDKNYPEVHGSIPQKLQFYSMQWKAFLEQMVESKLILAEAETKKDEGVQVSTIEVRKEIQQRFQPNVMEALNKLGMTYQEVHDMIHDELLKDKMLGRSVQAKAYFSVTPSDIQKEYTKFARENPPKDEFVYQVFTVRSDEQEEGKKIAQSASDLVHLASDSQDSSISFDNLEEKLKNAVQIKENVNLSTSKEYTLESSKLSESHKSALLSLNEGEFSQPISQKNRRTGKVDYRIFHLKERNHTPSPTYELMHDRLRGELMQVAYDKAMQKYMTKLQKKYKYSPAQTEATLPKNYQPFSYR